MSETRSTGLPRRSLLATAGLATAGVAAGSGAITGFPTIWAQKIRNITLRQVGTGVSNLNAIADKVTVILLSPIISGHTKIPVKSMI